MKHIKTFEDSSWKGERDELLSSAALYLEEQQPIKTDDGFIECVYDSEELFCFIFSFWTMEESYDTFFKFLKDNKLKIKDELQYGEKYEIQVKLSEKKIKEFASLYNSIQKYNL